MIVKMVDIPMDICKIVTTFCTNFFPRTLCVPNVRTLSTLLVFAAFLTFHRADSASQRPVFLKQPESDTSYKDVGQRKILQCDGVGDPKPTYRWLKNGRFLSSSSPTLQLLDLKISDNGAYQCVISNEHGSLISLVAQVKVAYIDSITDTSPRSTVVAEGKAAILMLPAVTSKPVATVKWKQGSTVLRNGGLNYYAITLDNDLIILSSTAALNGNIYRATIQNGITMETRDSPEYTLTVTGGSSSGDVPPTIVVPLKNASVPDRGSIKLECIVNARPLADISIKWYRIRSDQSKEDLSTSKHIIIYHDRQLVMTTLEKADEGWYECHATLKTYPAAVSSAYLSVYTQPQITRAPPRTQQKDYGQSIQIPCRASGTPPPTITWFFNAKSIASLASAKHKLLDTGELEVSSLSLSDAGVYQCFAVNDVGDTTASTWITVRSMAPMIEEAPKNMSVVDGEDAQLVCRVKGAPTPKVKWVREVLGGDPEPVLGKGRFVLTQDKLLITVTTPQDSGAYTCTASNSQGSTSATAHLRVAIKTQIVKPPRNETVIKGNSIDLLCEVTHDSSIVIRRVWWRATPPSYTRVNLPLAGSSRITVGRSGNLHIVSVSGVDKGRYVCEVVSAGGNDTKSAYLAVVEIPKRPVITSVVHNPNKKRSVIITWNHVFDGYSPITKFKFQYRVIHSDLMNPDEGWTNLNDKVAPDKLSHTIDNLTPARKYSFRLTASNAVGESEPSVPRQEHYIELPEEPPGGAPRGFRGAAISSKSIRLDWQPPPGHLWNGYLTGYEIRYWVSGYIKPQIQEKKVQGIKILSFVLDELLVFQLYDITISAWNRAGRGVRSNIITVKTLEGLPSAPPTSVRASAVSSTEIVISWEPIVPNLINGELKEYEVAVTRVDGSESSRVVTETPADSRQSVSVSQLSKYKQYRVTVVGVNGVGRGPHSTAVLVTTQQDVPGKVSHFKTTLVRDTLINIVWGPPKQVNGILTGYNLHYEQVNNTNTRISINNIPPSTNHYNLSGLVPETMYTITIIARTQKGSGPAFYTNIKSGVPPELPEPPKNLGVSDIRHSSVKLQFHQGFNGKTLITLWVVEADAGLRGVWAPVYQISDPQATQLIVKKLHPYTNYRLRVIAENIKGRSGPSSPTRNFQTSQKAPGSPPGSVTVRAINATAVRVSWTPLATKDWNGVPRVYKIYYRRQGVVAFKSNTVKDVNSDSYILVGLEEWVVYEVKVMAVNEVGMSAFSRVAIERTRETVPSSGPQSVNASAKNSTSIYVSWKQVPFLQQNGHILGYKVRYTCTCGDGQRSVVDVIKNGSRYHHQIFDLRKYTLYDIEVLAYTIMGDGVYSAPVASVRTLEGIPGPPIIIYFPEVTYTRAKIVWESPAEPNGVIAGYKVGHYMKNQTESAAIYKELGAQAREYVVTTLVKNTYYYFTVKAKTRLGWGTQATVLVYTMINREIPESPTQPMIGKMGRTSREITISWTPRKDGYGPLRNFTVEYRYRNGQWQSVNTVVSPAATSYTVTNLRPNTWYQFRVAATNDIGTSMFSKSSDEVRTLEDKPEGPPRNLKVKPLTTTSVRATWNPPVTSTWNGQLTRYIVQYRRDDQDNYIEVDVAIAGVSIMSLQKALVSLDRGVNYEVRVLAVNNQGRGPHSTPVTVYVGDAAPSAPPRDFHSRVLSSTAVRLAWKPPVFESHNGILSGYMVKFWRENDGEQAAQRRISAENTTTLERLDVYTMYGFTVHAMNLAGDGPRTGTIWSRTDEEAPGPPGPIRFTRITHSSVEIGWVPPLRPNGHITRYNIKYSPSITGGRGRNITESVVDDQLPYLIGDLLSNHTYMFSVWASTSKGPGSTISDTVFIGPQSGSPEPPSKPSVQLEGDTLRLTWTILGSKLVASFIIQRLDLKDRTPVAESGISSSWKEVLKVNDSMPEATITLSGTGSFVFRVMSVNSYGLSWPGPQSDVVIYTIPSESTTNATTKMPTTKKPTTKPVETTTAQSVPTTEGVWKRNDIKCLDDSIELSIPAEAVPFPHSRHLNSPRCYPYFDSVKNTLEISFKHSECGTKMEITDEGIVYTNELKERYDSAKSVAIKCVYKSNGLASASFDTFDRKKSLVETGEGSIDVKLLQYKDSLFKIPYADDAEVLKRQNGRAYFRLEVVGNNLVGVSAEKCVITSESDATGSGGVTIIEKGCSTNKKVSVLSSTKTLAFDIAADLLTTNGKSYVHCDVVLCPRNGCFTCGAGMKRVRRRARNVIAMRSVLVR